MEDRTDTPEEILDLVDENDNVVGEVKKSEANKDPRLLHREVGILLCDDQRRLLLQQRSYNKPIRPGVWEVTAAGHMNKGEDPAVAAHRELLEELGFDANLFLLKSRDKTF